MTHISRRSFLKLSATLPISVLLPDSTNSADLLQTIRKRIYIAPDDHTDYFWSGDEEEYRQAFLAMLDYYLKLADTTTNEPPEHQYRWNCDGSFWMWTYEKNKPAADFDRLISRIRDGHITVPLNALCVCLGGAPAEAVLRGMYYPGQIERRHNLRFPLALAMENQTLSYGLIALWAGAGAKYSWKGICGCDTLVENLNDREHEIYWAIGPDGSKVLMKWYSVLNESIRIGSYAEAADPHPIVDYVDTNPNFKSHYPYDVIGVFGEGGDNLQTLDDKFPQLAEELTNGNRQIIVSNQRDFFEDFEQTYGNRLMSVACSFGNEWDLYCATMAETSASVKRSVEKLRSAEALATLVSLHRPTFMNSRTAARDQAWMDLGLFWEHNWAVDGVFDKFGEGRIKWQRRLASEIQSYVDELQDDAKAALAEMIPNTGSAFRFFAFNPLSWARTDIADLPFSGSESVHVVDLSTKAEVPSQIVTIDGQRYLRILAKDVPPVGYKVFEVRPGTGMGFPGVLNVDSSVIENSLYRVRVAERGAIESLIDKTRDNREFVKEIGQRTVNDLGPGTGTLKAENAGPVSATLLATSDGPLDHTTRITLIRDVNRIDISNNIQANFNKTLTWAFGFELDAPDVWHEEVGAIIRARLLADQGHYSPRNARYDWLTLNHFADITGSSSVGITLSNADCYFMRLGNSTATHLDVSTPQISTLAGGRVGGDGHAGIPNQGGDTHFLQRFALRTHGVYDPTAAMRFSLEHQNPLVTGVVKGGNDHYPENAFSLLSISNPDVLLWALKPAEEGIETGIVVRVWNLASERADFSLKLSSASIVSAEQTSHIETPTSEARVTDGALTETLERQQLKTFLINGAKPA
jgi:alpha-mannosidase